MKGGGSVTKLPMYIYIFSSHSNSLVGGQKNVNTEENVSLCLFAMTPKSRSVEDAPVDCLLQLWQEPPLRADR